ncbi:putative bifunctional diguanylate cyclase/phosphodiesterase [Actinoplanes friuliensis]|uniref:Phytochrome-like protein cph2 n=1 Tax=Actinoplanes friuliensis DSM 7358 TaxID=1246995 RepID=U5VXW5_9ACTN|nr:EAL domain-containing protein [Actinoplanes friuliensis]AGZ41838.1 Phytochrome-like protein cph2 [Actinoplanes friuliensis DSM 7358]
MWRRQNVRRRSGTGSRLFLAYAVASLVLVLLLGVMLVRSYRDDAEHQGREQGRAQASVIEEMAVAPALDGAELAAGLTATQLERLQGATDLAIFHGSVVRLRVRSYTGQVVFSDDGSTAGGISVSSAAFRAAVAGQVDIAVVADSQRSAGKVIRVLQPVIAGASGQAIGVLELYLPYDAIDAQLQRQMTATYWRLGVTLAILYLVLALIAWSTTRSLRRHAARREHEALHDGLTGLPNRAAFRERARTAISVATGSGGEGAIVLVDLNRFKEVNDTLGHHAGDELLRLVGSRLGQALRTGDTVARLGGDEFGLILPALPGQDVLDLLEEARRELTRETVLDGVPLSIEASFGVALYPHHGTEVEELLQHADAAMYQGKRGAVDVVLYAEGGVANPTHWLMVQAELRHAIDRDELVLHYQPKVRFADDEIGGLEALVRWQHPQRGLLPPSEFLPAAEQSGVIEVLTAWVLRRALEDQAGWTALGQSWPVAVNVSARNLEAPGFPQFVAGLLAEHSTPPGQLLLEVTETALAGDAEIVARAVVELRALGIGVAVDDFGIGYTSLSQLRTVPVSEVKIDRLFVIDLDQDPQNQAIVRSVIELAHGLGCRVTAEGVETAQVSAWLAEAGCDDAQGYLYSRPVVWPHLLDLFLHPRSTGRHAALDEPAAPAQLTTGGPTP